MEDHSDMCGKWGWPSEFYKADRENSWQKRGKGPHAKGSRRSDAEELRGENDDVEDLGSDESAAGPDESGGAPQDEGCATSLREPACPSRIDDGGGR